MYVQSLKALLRVVGLTWEIVVAVVITQTNAGKVLGSKIIHPKLKIGFTPYLGVWKGTKMYNMDRYLKAEMSEGAIGIRFYISRALRSSMCEGLGPYAYVQH